MSKQGLWGEIGERVAKGEQPTLELPVAMRVIRPKLPPHRPRTKPVGARGHYGWKMVTTSGRAMRCRNPGCGKEVRKHSETLVCGGACREELAFYCRSTLDVLEGRVPASKYPMRYRAEYSRRPKKCA